MKTLRRLLLGVLLLVPAPAALSAELALREEFLRAWEAAAAATPMQDSDALRGFLLYPDLQARRLAAQVDTPAADSAIMAQLDGPWGRVPSGRSLRLQWLDALAARGDWATYLRYDDGSGGDRRACLAAQARIALAPQAAETRTAALQLWQVGRSQPAACDPVFDWLRARGALGPQRVVERAELALAAGEVALGRHLARQLPAELAAPLLRWADFVQTPQAAIDALLARPEQPVEAPALRQAWDQLSRRAPDAAYARHAALRQRIAGHPHAAALQTELGGMLGLGAAISRKAWALEVFAPLPLAELAPLQQEWHVRAALFAGDWSAVLRGLDALPPTLAAELRWRYWRARALQATGADEPATALYRELALQRDYYGFLAADRLGQDYRLNDQALPRDAALLSAVAADTGLQRAALFRSLGLKAEAQREWQQALTERDAGWRIAAAQWAHAQGWYLQSITALVSANEWNDLSLRFPLPWPELILPAAQAEGLPPAWIYALIRQETLFNPDALSSADARGLMQLLPSTARQIAAARGLGAPTPNSLLLPQVNIPLGVAHLAFEFEAHGRRLADTLGAYNAGPRAVARWIDDRDDGHDIDVWIENIPYNETRAYISRIGEYIICYSYRLQQPSLRLSALLGEAYPAPSRRASGAAP